MRNVVTTTALTHRPGRREFRPARLAGRDRAGRTQVSCPTTTNSAAVAQLAAADGFVVIPEDSAGIPEGGLVEFLPLTPAQ